MNEFVTWQTLATFASLITVVFTVTEFTKELPFVRELKTKYLSWIVAFVLITITNLVLGTFQFVDVLLYSLSAIFISLGSNGISDFNSVVDKTKKDV